MGNTHSEFDVFISYAREDAAWVKEHVYLPLSTCRTSAGESVRIFYDTSRDGGIRAGENFQRRLSEAIQHSVRILPIYSQIYFHKPMCQWELDMAHRLDADGSKGLVVPLLLDGDASIVPFGLQHVNFIDVQALSDWFSRLCNGLGLVQAQQTLHLRFAPGPKDTYVNYTLPPVRVRVCDGDGLTQTNIIQVAIDVEGGGLQGTVIVETQEGVATFDDLSIDKELPDARLIARANGVEACYSDPFHVLRTASIGPSASAPAGTKAWSGVDARGQAVFFQDGQAVAVLEDEQVRVFGLDGGARDSSPPATLTAPVRLIRRQEDQIALAEWSGRIHLLDASGRHISWAFDEWSTGGGFVVPGDLAFDERALRVGMWNGMIGRLTEDGGAEWGLCHRRGVTRVAVLDRETVFVDTAGQLCVAGDEGIEVKAGLERLVWSLKAYPNHLVAIGEGRLYHIDPSRPTWQVIDEPPPGNIENLSAVWDESPQLVFVDRFGRGAQCDGELNIVAVFLTAPGSEPVCADDLGRYCVLRISDGSHTLLAPADADPTESRRHVVFSHPGGALAVSPDATVFAIGEKDNIRIIPAQELRQYFGGTYAENESAHGRDTTQQAP